MVAYGFAHIQAYGHVVIFDALLQGAVAYCASAIDVCCSVLALLFLQFFERMFSTYHSLYGIGTEPVEVDNGGAVCPRPHVASGPFLRVAVCSHGYKVASRNDERGVSGGYYVGERQVARVGMILHLAHKHGECPYMCRHEQMCSACRLCPSLQCTVVYGAELVGMVAVVGARTGVVE